MTILRGPNGAKVHLDKYEIYPDDPGQGTPVLVEWEGHFGTYNCCTDTGEIDGWELPKNVLEWLNGLGEQIDEWLTEETKSLTVKQN